MATKKTPSSPQRMHNYRIRLRRAGLRPVQIWVPDQRADGFSKTLRAQVARLNARDEADALGFIEHIGDWSAS